MVHGHMNKTWISLLAISGTLVLTSCAHQSKVTPSTGHIDGQSPAQQTQANSTLAASDIPKPVTSITYLPPPTPKAKEQTYSVVVNEVPVKEILFALARESKLNIDIHPSIQGRVTLNAVDQTLPAILERLSKQVDLTYKVENNVLSITPDHPVLRTYKVDYVNMSRDTNSSIGAVLLKLLRREGQRRQVHNQGVQQVQLEDLVQMVLELRSLQSPRIVSGKL